MSVSKGIESFLNYVREMEQLHRISIANEQQANDETQDILHSLELGEHSYHDQAHLAANLREIRKKTEGCQGLDYSDHTNC